MTNIRAPYQTVTSTKNTYSSMNLMDLPFVFEIPIYEGIKEAEYPQNNVFIAKNFGFSEFLEWQKANELPLDVHLMCSNPKKYIKE